MNLGMRVRSAALSLKTISAVKAAALSLALAFAPAAIAQMPAAKPAAAAAAAAPAVPLASPPVVAGAVATPTAAQPAAPQPAAVLPAAPPPAMVVAPLTPAQQAHLAVAPGGYTPMKPTLGKGMPDPGGWTFQKQYSPIGQYGLWFHNTILIWVCIVISVFVLALLIYVMIRFRASANPIPSKTSHNTTIEIVWTLLPVLILLGIAIPSIDMLSKQYKAAPAKSLTVKATGNQWYWSYSYPDNGGFEVVSNMLSKDAAEKNGEPEQLAADNRMVLPVGEPIRLQTTGADVIHAFAVPSLWFKLDAVPGRINEKVLRINEPGVYYGQCSELCGARHGYMPIVVEALPRDKFNAWVMTHADATIDGAPKPVIAAAVAPAAGAVPAAGTAPKTGVPAAAAPAPPAVAVAPAAAKPAA